MIKVKKASLVIVQYLIIFNLVDLLFDGNFTSSEQCDNLTFEQLENYRAQWSLCNTSLCSNNRLHYYLKHLQASSIFKNLYKY